MKIYLAGKIGKGDWRNRIIEGNRAGGIWDRFPAAGWEHQKGVIFREHDYTGPFFTSCDHGCSHGSNTHGNGESPCTDLFEGDRRTSIVRLCMTAINESELVFAWIDKDDAYGTLAEIGYAVARGIPTVVAMSEVRKDLWFPAHMAHATIIRDNPADALRLAIRATSSAMTHRRKSAVVRSPDAVAHAFMAAMAPNDIRVAIAALDAAPVDVE